MKKNEYPDQDTLDRWSRDPDNWFLGMFYFNPRDPRLMPPKRIAALGWTVNFANPRSVFLSLGIILVLILIFGNLK